MKLGRVGGAGTSVRGTGAPGSAATGPDAAGPDSPGPDTAGAYGHEWADPEAAARISRAGIEVLRAILGTDPPVGVELWDGTSLGRPTATRLVVRRPDALRRALFAPGELGLVRAYVAGDLDVDGDIFEALELGDTLGQVRANRALLRSLATLLRELGPRPPRPPAEERRLRGRLHSRRRDAEAISHHYDVSNDFYRLVLGDSMTYSCGVWPSPAVGLEQAQATKHELVCRKLGLAPGQRLLDIGCGWGSLLIHAARHHGVTGVGITLSCRQAELARERLARAGLAGRVEIRVQDYRDVGDGPYDAVSSIGMVEHVGTAMLPVYFRHLRDLLRPGGRLLNHGISFPGDPAGAARSRPRIGAVPLPSGRSFIDRYVFPDGELHEIGETVTTMQAAGFEARHVESLREHYPLTLRAWVANLEKRWDEAVAAVGESRARVWRLYMAGSAVGFERGRIQIHQVLAVRPDEGRSGLPLRPGF